jgi:hypothetical protein
MPPLLAALALLAPARTVAGPPEGASGKMVFDRVGAGLDRYRKEKDPEKRCGWWRRLAPTRDPRVGVALIDTLPAGSTCVTEADILLDECFVKGTRFHVNDSYLLQGWLEANEADLRRRAAQLPR